LEIIYFYRYDDIKALLTTKHTPLGHRVFHRLGKLAAQGFTIPYDALPIDHSVKSGYSHSAIIAKHMAKHTRYNLLQAQNEVNYSGKTLAFRKNNPRDFIYRGKGLKRAVLVDDIFTTATTLLEAKKVLRAQGVEVPYAVTLAH
jgi:competence protein ComFC